MGGQGGQEVKGIQQRKVKKRKMASTNSSASTAPPNVDGTVFLSLCELGVHNVLLKADWRVMENMIASSDKWATVDTYEHYYKSIAKSIAKSDPVALYSKKGRKGWKAFSGSVVLYYITRRALFGHQMPVVDPAELKDFKGLIA